MCTSWLFRAQAIPILTKEKCKGFYRLKLLIGTESAPSFSTTKVKKNVGLCKLDYYLHGIREENQMPSEMHRIPSFPFAMKKSSF